MGQRIFQMTRSRHATLSIGLAFFFAACSSSTPPRNFQGQAGSGVTDAHAGSSSGNTAGTSSGNAAGTSSGNTAGDSNSSGGNNGTTGGSSGTTAGTSAGGGAAAGANGQAGGSSSAGGGPIVVNLPDVVTSADG